MSDIVVGIDLGTTNSEIAAHHQGRVCVLGSGRQQMLPSCVGIAPSGELLIGQAARNQQLLYPERTVRSVKRRMGSEEVVRLGDQTFSPPEVSALILREVVRWAEAALGAAVKRAIITVPAYFSDAQRQATRMAGELAGLEVVRLVNEPTAASLAYGVGADEERTVMVYDLGGGTFDVSIVRVSGEVTEVLASHGNPRLGGDDFDELLCGHLVEAFRREHGVDLRDRAHLSSFARLWWAAEEAKKRLSFEPFATVREENLAIAGGTPRHLELEVARSDYERMIRPLVESTLESVSRALADASLTPDQIDVALLVGGSTRTPLISEVLEERLGKAPRQDIHPDLCVALGAGVLASRAAGHDVERVLVDVSPFSFGVSYLGERDGLPYSYCYRPIIARGTPLPVTRTELFYTAYEGQTEVEVEIFQGEDADAANNVRVGNFTVSGLVPTEEPNEVLCRMRLDLSGILEVTAIEKRTSLARQVRISGATSAAPRRGAADRLAAIFAARAEHDAAEEPAFGEAIATSSASAGAGGGAEAGGVITELKLAVEGCRVLVGRCRALLESLHADDRLEAVDLNEEAEMAMAGADEARIARASEALREFLFFVEGR